MKEKVGKVEICLVEEDARGEGRARGDSMGRGYKRGRGALVQLNVGRIRMRERGKKHEGK